MDGGCWAPQSWERLEAQADVVCGGDGSTVTRTINLVLLVHVEAHVSLSLRPRALRLALALGPGPRVHDRQSPMKNLEVKFSLSELEFRCKNLFLIWEKHLGSKNLMVAFFICNPTSITWPLLLEYVKVGK